MAPTRECKAPRSPDPPIVRPFDDVAAEGLTTDELRRAQHPIAAYVIVAFAVMAMIAACLL